MYSFYHTKYFTEKWLVHVRTPLLLVQSISKEVFCTYRLIGNRRNKQYKYSDHLTLFSIFFAEQFTHRKVENEYPNYSGQQDVAAREYDIDYRH